MSEQTKGFTQIKGKISLADQIHDQILEMIIKNPSPENQVLNEKRLTELFEVSKAPVREALIKLCSEDVLMSVPRFGYMVIQRQEKDYQDVKKMRIMLEKEALQISFPNLTEEKLEAIQKQILRASTKRNVDVWQVWEDNEEFHMLLASYSENKILLKFLKECMGMEKRAYAQKVWKQKSNMDDSVDGTPHCDIYTRLCARDLEGALLLLEEDIAGKEYQGEQSLTAY